MKKESEDIVRTLLEKRLDEAKKIEQRISRVKTSGKDPTYLEAVSKYRSAQLVLDAYDGKHFRRVITEIDDLEHHLLDRVYSIEEVRKMGDIPEEKAEDMKDELYLEIQNLIRCRRQLIAQERGAKHPRKKR